MMGVGIATVENQGSAHFCQCTAISGSVGHMIFGTTQFCCRERTATDSMRPRSMKAVFQTGGRLS